MSALEAFVGKVPREKGGSTATNRFEYQLNWAFCHLLELHKSGKEYLMVLDYHDDVVVFDSATSPTSMQFLQIKTRSQQQGAWRLKDLMRRAKKKENSASTSLSILGKLYSHHVDFGPLVSAVIFVSNANYSLRLQGEETSSSKHRFEVDDITLDDFKTLSNQLEEEHALGFCPTEGLQIAFKTDSLSLEDHTAHAKGRLSEFAADYLGVPACPVNHAYNAIIQALRTKQNWEFTAETPVELLRKKGFSQMEFSTAINKLRKHSTNNSWSLFESMFVQEDVDILTIRRLHDAWDSVAIQTLDSTNHVLHGTMATIKSAVETRLKAEQPKPLGKFLQSILEEVYPTIDGDRLPFDKNDVSAMVLQILDESSSK